MAESALPEPTELQALAMLLGAPDAESRETLDALQDVCPWLGSVLPALDEWPLEQWQAEHTRLFINGYPHTACPPYLSVYRHGEMCGDVASELWTLYRQAGLEAVDMPPDYLGTLLLFAAHQRGVSQPAFASLWSDYLASWLPDFGAALREAAELPLYRALGTRLEEIAHEAA